MPDSVRPHVNEFVRLSGIHGLSLNPANLAYVEFVDSSSFSGDKVAVCEFALLGVNPMTVVWPYHKTVTISKQWWEENPGLQREQLVFHEMAHCFLNREHKCSGMTVMYPNLRDPWTYRTYRDTFIEELFNNVGDSTADKCPGE